MLFATKEQRHILDEDDAPLPLVDADTGKCYMVMPVEITPADGGFFRAQMPGFVAVAEAEEPSDAVFALALLTRKMLEPQ